MSDGQQTGCHAPCDLADRIRGARALTSELFSDVVGKTVGVLRSIRSTELATN